MQTAPKAVSLFWSNLPKVNNGFAFYRSTVCIIFKSPSSANGVGDVRAEFTRVSEGVEVGATQHCEHHSGFPAMYRQHLYPLVSDNSSDDFSILNGTRGRTRESLGG